MSPQRSLAAVLWAILAAFAFVHPSAARPRDTACEAGAGPRIVQADLAGVHAVLRIPARVAKAPIVLWHGFGPPDSAAALMDALPLDDVPAVKVYLDLPLFGARAPADPADSAATRQSQDYALRLFQPAVMGAADELPRVVAVLASRGCLAPGQKVGLFGFSAGAAAVLVALADHKAPISAAIVLNPAVGLAPGVDALEHATHRPYAWTPAARAIATRSDAIARAAEIASGRPPPALLILQGQEDSVISAKGPTALNRALQPYYAGRRADRRLALETPPSLGHDWTNAAGRALVGSAASGWFNDHL